MKESDSSLTHQFKKESEGQMLKAWISRQMSYSFTRSYNREMAAKWQLNGSTCDIKNFSLFCCFGAVFLIDK